MPKVFFTALIILLNINITTADCFDEGMIAGLIVNRINTQKTCPKKSIIPKNKTLNLKHYNYQCCDTEIENYPFYHISQLHQCYEKKTLKTLSIYEKFIHILIIASVVSFLTLSIITSTDEQRNFCCGLIMGIIIDSFIHAIFDDDDNCD